MYITIAAYAHPIEDRVVEEYKADQNRKFDQKINRTNALLMTQDILIAASGPEEVTRERKDQRNFIQ